MAECQMRNCKNKTAVHRAILTPGGTWVEGMYCVDCAVKILNGVLSPLETDAELAQRVRQIAAAISAGNGD